MRLSIAITAAVLFAAAANAQTGHEDHAMSMPAAVSATEAPASPSTEAYMAANTDMHYKMMATKYTGDADVDFLRGMIPHHQGAIDMANIVLKYGNDPDVRMLAGDIIKAQENEIRVMNAWLAKHGPKETPHVTTSASLPPMPASSEAISNTTPQMEMLNK